MRTTQRRVGRLETAAGTTHRPALVVVLDDGDGVWRDLQTGAVVVPPPGALLVVFRERKDGPQ
ncbi:MAG: hypothetical protein M3R02_10675 [Chloroflexota bacterium]|nr:hypothetical protein [Chloroflexota bacterium]